MTTQEPRSGLVNDDGGPGRLHFLVGLPQSGKSSVANAWCRAAPVWYDLDRGTNHYVVTRPRVVVGGDDFRQAVYQMEYSRQGEGLVFGIMDAACRALLARGFDVLVDETATTEATLLRYFLIDPEAVPILVDTPEDECVRRALASGKDYLVEPIRQMARQREELLRGWPAALDRVRDHIRRRYPNTRVRVG